MNVDGIRKISLNKVKNKNDGSNIEFLSYYERIKTMPIKITIAYFLIGGILTLFFNKILDNFIESNFLMNYIQSIEELSYIIITSIAIYFLISKFTKKSKNSFNKFKNDYEKIQVDFDKLLDAKDELRMQYEELTKKQLTTQTSEERYKLAIECTNDTIWEIDLGTNEFFSTDKFNDITGYDKNIIKTLADLIKYIAPEDREVAEDEFMNHIMGKSLYYRSTVKLKYNGIADKWILIRGKCLRDSKGIATKISGSMTDVSNQKNSEETINKLQYYDMLTDLPNRKLFMNTLENEINKAMDNKFKLAVLFIDIDNFKEINDTSGHDYGDKLLKKVATLFNKFIKEGNFVSRVGGDEFFVLMSNIEDYEQISILCDRLQSLLNCEINMDDTHVYTSASIGITVFPDDGDKTNILLKNADTAMYSAKYNGKCKYSFFNRTMSDVVVRHVEIEKGLRNAIKNNELEIYYQPQIDIINNKIKGFEALLRWNSAELGRIGPDEFIPVAEQSGLLIPMGDWIIETVCIQNNIWKNKGYLYDTIAINLSSIQLENHKFEKTLKKLIVETKINPKYVELEITESILMKDFDNNIKLLTDIRDLGVNIALDDFGTGYSSLSYLKQLPINTLKIDKSFIDNIVTNDREKAIVDGIIQLAQKIDLEVIAEGAESKEQIRLLHQMGCNQIQGYYFSKPLPANEIEEKFLKTNWIESYN
ncbi:sensor domain-containing protein [Clostridium psychrophilum]|uniref:sensor domain-containing protein n=1 Tax=Clostridium psychrophilum TaxID=132926 RepID=UPI001C0AB999|nr:EAL domain-containing protein [Clostridium psychrophilum]MBU3179743.1 EAL domain-containing protein [Clostridium psychrophilum]